MAEQLASLKCAFREHGREAVVAQLGRCTQKVLRATAKAAGLAQKVSGRYLTTEELRQNLLEHALASTQVGVGWLAFFFACVFEHERSEAGDTNKRFLCMCLPRSHKMDRLVFSMSGSSKSKRRHEEAAAIERDSGGGRS